jgi:hypothetical protein
LQSHCNHTALLCVVQLIVHRRQGSPPPRSTSFCLRLLLLRRQPGGGASLLLALPLTPPCCPPHHPRPPPQTLSSGDLAAFKIVDLVEIAGKKGVSAGRNATRDSLLNALSRAGVTINDLTKGQQAELKSAGGSSGGGYSSSPASSGGDRFANYARSSGSSSSSSYGASSGGSGAGLSAGDLSAFKIVDLVEIAGKKGVSAGRNATRESLTDGLVRAGISLADLSRGQLVDLGIKLGKAGLSRDINQARAELASLIGGSGSSPSRCACWAGLRVALRLLVALACCPHRLAGSPSPRALTTPAAVHPAAPASCPHSWRSTPAPVASSGDRFASYSSSRPAASNGRSAGGSSSGARLGAVDLAALRIDDLRDLVKKTGAELPREATRDNVISALVSKGVSLDHMTRGELLSGGAAAAAAAAAGTLGLAGSCVAASHAPGLGFEPSAPPLVCAAHPVLILNAPVLAAAHHNRHAG